MSKTNLETTQSTPIEWRPFACPSCQGLFRAPSQAETTVICPFCEDECLIPAPQQSEKRTRRVRRRKKGSSNKTFSWEDSEEVIEDKRRRHTRRFLRIMTFILSISAVVLIVEVVSSKLEDKELQKAVTLLTQNLPEKSANGNTPEEPLIEINLEQIEACKEVTQQFLEAPNIAALEPIIRDPERVFPLLVEYYANKPYQPESVQDTMDDGVSQTIGKFVSFSVILRDYSKQLIALEVTADGPKVDWESWVGYSEQTPNDLILTQPTHEVLLRTKISADSYYNFDFNDDQQWVSYRLHGENNQPSLQAYLDINSPLISNLPRIGDPPRAFIIKIKYPQKVRAPDQVILTEVISEGWVLGATKLEQ